MLDGIWIAPLRPVFSGSLLDPFVEQEALALACRRTRIPGALAWRHARALLLGSRDAALPNAERAAVLVCGEGYTVSVRPFGGLAVPADGGVAHLSLILPGERTLDQAFSIFSDLLAESLSAFADIKAGEVEGGYCPGRFDLAAGGKKIAGVAQRRIAGVSVVSAFVNVLPDPDRELVVERWYRLARGPGPGIGVPRLRRGAVGDLLSIAGGETSAASHRPEEDFPVEVCRRFFSVAAQRYGGGRDGSPLVEADLREARRRLSQGPGWREWRDC